MKRCNSCKISITNPLSYCPLCYTTLVAEDIQPEVVAYPNLSEMKSAYSLLIKILVFISVTTIAVSVTINALTPIGYPWSLIVTICVVYVWVAFGTAIKKRKKIGFNLLIQLLSLGLFLILLGSIVGFKASVYNYMFPALVASAMLSFNILSIIKRKEIKEFLIYYLIVGALGFVPSLLLATGQVKVSWPAISCAVYCGLSIISIFIFAYRATKTELSKRLHL